MNTIMEFLDKYPYLFYALRIILAGICGFAIGLERYINNKSAGVRTHVIVCCASALFMMVSMYGFTDAVGLAGVRDADPSRIAAQVVTGISFLGAGMIFRDKDRDSIKGLTTAAGIWSTAAIGLAIGAGMYFISIFVTVFIILFQVIISKTRLVPSKDMVITYRLQITVKGDSDFYNVLYDKATEMNAQITKMHITKNDDDTITYRFNLYVSQPHDSMELSEFMREHEEVKDISGNPL